jgi:hypothetical protein
MDKTLALFLGALTLAFAVLGSAYVLTPTILELLESDPLVSEQAFAPTSLGASPGDCTAQHQKYVGVSTSDLLARDFEIKSAVPGGIWLQKKKEVFYCNSGVTADNDTVCWKITAPVRGLDCNTVRSGSTARALGG